MFGTGVAFALYNRAALVVALYSRCGDESLTLGMVFGLHGARNALYYLLTLCFYFCFWAPRRLFYEALVIGTYAAWQWKILFNGSSYLCHFIITVDLCRDPEKGDICADCDDFGYSVLMDVMIWVLLMPSVVVTRVMMLSLMMSWLLVFWWMSFFSARRESNEQKYVNANDAFVGAAFFVAIAWIALRRKKQMLKAQVAKFSLDLEQAMATQNMFSILQYMVPHFLIARILKQPAHGPWLAQKIDRASVMFITLEGLEHVAQSPSDLLAFLNRAFTLFDKVCKDHQVTKIETFKEDFVCAVGVVPEDIDEGQAKGHGVILGRLLAAALDVLDKQEALDAALPDVPSVSTTGSSERPRVALKVGVHTGSLVAGIVGEKLPRFRLFGDTVNIAARMMQKGARGAVQFGQETHRDLPRWASAVVVERGQIEMKGKGLVSTYLLHCRAGQERHRVMPSESATSSAPSRLSRSLALQQHDRYRQQPSGGVVGALLDGALRKTASLGERLYALHRGGEAHSSKNWTTGLGSSESVRTYAVASEFDRVLQEMHEKQNMASTEATRAQPWYSMRRLCCCWADFPVEAEGIFRTWFQNEKTCKGMAKRLGYQAFSLGALTMFEFIYLLFGSDLNHGTDLSMILRCLVTFIVARCSCLVLLLVLRGVVSSRVALSQAQLVGACWIIATLLFVSYDSLDLDLWNGAKLLSSDTECKYEPGDVMRGTSAMGVSQNVPKLIFFPVYAVTITAYPFPFVHSISFLVLTLILVFFVHNLPGLNQLPLTVSKSYIIFFCMVFVLEAYLEESLCRGQFKASWTVDETHRRISNTLNALIPHAVAVQLREGYGVSATSHTYDAVTLAQSDLCGFTQLAGRMQPEKVVEIISDLFGRFDMLADRYGVYKVETVGDAYIAGQGGYPLTQIHSARDVLKFAIGMVHATAAWSEGLRMDEDVTCRVGVHTGPCVGGIVGNDMQRYHLFGPLTTCLEVLESTSHPGSVHVSRACKEAVEAWQGSHAPAEAALHFEARTGDGLLGAKGDVYPFSAAGGRPTYFASMTRPTSLSGYSR